MSFPSHIEDKPLDSIELLSTSHQELVNNLCEILQVRPFGPILITGDWGAGKTSILKAVQRKLGDMEKEQRPSTAFFEAWHHENQAGLLPALLRCLWDTSRQGENPGQVAGELWGKLWRCAVVAGSKTLPLAASAFGLAPLFEVLKGVDVKNLAENLQILEASPPVPDDPVTALRDSFSKFVKKIWPAHPPTVFIDDLDRCSPEGAVSLLEGIRLLVAGEEELGCRFVVALDREILVQAVTNKYAGIPAFDGNRYLEKVFPFELQVPSLDRNEAATVVRALLGDASSGSMSLNPDHFNALAGALSVPAFSNPRLMKRSINTFRLVVHLEHDPISGPEATTLAQWIVAVKRWPEIRRLMQRHDDIYWGKLGIALDKSESADVDPEARPLLAEPGATHWLRAVNLLESNPATAKRFRMADEQLRRHGL